MYILKNQNNSPTTLLKLTFSLKIFGVEKTHPSKGHFDMNLIWLALKGKRLRVGFNLLNFMKISSHPKETRAEQRPKFCENFEFLKNFINMKTSHFAPPNFQKQIQMQNYLILNKTQSLVLKFKIKNQNKTSPSILMYCVHVKESSH